MQGLEEAVLLRTTGEEQHRGRIEGVQPIGQSPSLETLPMEGVEAPCGGGNMANATSARGALIMAGVPSERRQVFP